MGLLPGRTAGTCSLSHDWRQRSISRITSATLKTWRSGETPRWIASARPVGWLAGDPPQWHDGWSKLPREPNAASQAWRFDSQIPERQRSCDCWKDPWVWAPAGRDQCYTSDGQFTIMGCKRTWMYRTHQKSKLMLLMHLPCGGAHANTRSLDHIMQNRRLSLQTSPLLVKACNGASWSDCSVPALHLCQWLANGYLSAYGFAFRVVIDSQYWLWLVWH